MNRTVTYSPGDSHLTVSFDYDPAATLALKRIPGAAFDGESKRWRVPVTSAAALHTYLVDFRFDIAPRALDLIVQQKARSVSLTRLSAAIEHPGLDVLAEVPLRPYQRVGVEYALRTRRCFIADEMGLGKTITSLAAVEADEAWPAVVVAPASMKLVWRDELAKWFPHRECHVLSGRTGSDLGMTPADLYVVNYDIVSGWLKPLLAVGLGAVVLDEVHYVRNTGTARIKAVKALTLRVSRNGGLLLGLTGTPLHLRPDNLRVQLEVLRRLDDIGGYPLFKSRYSKGDNALELHQRLRATCYLRRTKDMPGVADDLPEKMAPVVMHFEGSKAGMAEYRKAERDTAKWFADRAAELAAEMGEDPKSAAVAAKMRAESALHLVRIAALKRLAAMAKMPSVIEWVHDFLEGGRKLVIFAHHRDVVDALTEEFGALKVQGGMTAEERLGVVKAFQEDPDRKVIVLSIGAGGVGLTLTAASDVLFVEMGWSPAEHDQATDRCHRIGQRNIVTPYYALCERTFDQDTFEVLAARRRIMDAVVDGREVTDEERTVLDPYEVIRRFQEGS